MECTPPSWPTFARELLAARDTLDLSTEVGLAIRADRHKRGLSQRAYAAVRGLTVSSVIRLETAASGLKLGDVVAALEGTDFMVCLCHRPLPPVPVLAAVEPPATPTGSDSARDDVREVEPGPPPEAPPAPVHPTYWPRSELVARVRGRSRRFPAHHVVEQTSSAPPWWWYAESTLAGAVAPDWYAPRFTRRRPSA